jgi:hypothetical protein
MSGRRRMAIYHRHDANTYAVRNNEGHPQQHGSFLGLYGGYKALARDLAQAHGNIPANALRDFGQIFFVYRLDEFRGNLEHFRSEFGDEKDLDV